MLRLAVPLVLALLVTVAVLAAADRRNRPLVLGAKWLGLEDMHEDDPHTVVVRLGATRWWGLWGTRAEATWPGRAGAPATVRFRDIRLPNGAFVLVSMRGLRPREDGRIVVRREHVYTWAPARAPEFARTVLERAGLLPEQQRPVGVDAAGRAARAGRAVESAPVGSVQPTPPPRLAAGESSPRCGAP